VATRKVKRGRHAPLQFFGGLLVVLLVLFAIIWRRTEGRARQRTLADLERQRVQLEGRAAALDAELRALSSRNRLASVVETTLGMHVPSDSQVVDLQVVEVPRAIR
jgi:cell division protein FtsL